MLIERLDHISLGVADVDAGMRDYAAVLGWPASGSRLAFGNIALELSSKFGDDPARTDLGLVFAVSDLGEAGRRLGRRAIACSPAGDGRLSLDRAATHGVAIDLIARGARTRSADDGHDIAGLDHVVVRTGDPERAVALYGGRLGLDLRLDRTNPDRGNRLLFFVCGDLVVEISHDTRKGITDEPDSIRGMAWRAADIDKAHARMTAAGVTVSEIRTGNRPGTRVFTVKSHTAGVPTLIIGGHGLVRK